MNVEEKARETVDNLQAGDILPHLEDWQYDALVSTLASQYAAAMRAPKDHIIDETGAVRRVLGTLPVTRDGCVPEHGGYVWDTNGNQVGNFYQDDGVWMAIDDHWEDVGGCDQFAVKVSDCYSTRAAAEAARSNA